MSEMRERFIRPLQYAVGASLIMSSSVAIVEASGDRPEASHEIVLDAEYVRELGGPVLALASSEGTVPAEEIPGHCEDYENMEAGTGHPVNQEWFDNLTVRDGEKGYARVRAACVHQWGTAEWYALDKLWQLENSGSDRPNWHVTNVPQAKPFSKMGCAPEDHRCQARWGMEYIDIRYDSPTKALRAWYARRPHWY
jgi:hypothetical protein